MSNEKLLINDSKSNNIEIKSNNEIDEMARMLCGFKFGCKVCVFGKEHCCDYEGAVNIYNAGYHKQIEGEWIITPPITMRVWESDCITCSVCGGKSVGLLEDSKLKYCPHCGAKMRGGD